MSENANNFLCEMDLGRWFGKNIYVQCCNFNSNIYCDNLYTQFEVDFPVELKGAVKKRRAEYLAGRCCAAKALDLCAHKKYQIKIGKNREPLWPKGFLGSISHSSHYAIAVVSNDSKSIGVGIDIEKIVSTEIMNDIWPSILNEEEEKLLLSIAKGRLEKYFTLFFSVKESFFKAAYPVVGRYFEFKSITIKEISKQKSAIVLQPNESLCPEFNKLKSYEVFYKYFDAQHLLTFLNVTNPK